MQRNSLLANAFICSQTNACIPVLYRFYLAGGWFCAFAGFNFLFPVCARSEGAARKQNNFAGLRYDLVVSLRVPVVRGKNRRNLSQANINIYSWAPPCILHEIFDTPPHVESNKTNTVLCLHSRSEYLVKKTVYKIPRSSLTKMFHRFPS